MIIKALGTAALTASVLLSASLPGPAALEGEIHSLVKEAVDQVTAMDDLEKKIQTYLKDNAQEGEEWSVAVGLPESGLSISFGGEPQTAASSIKLFLAGAVLENQDSLDIGYDDLMELITDTLISSDNEAATELTYLLGHGDVTEGKAVVNTFCQNHGYDETFMGIIFAGIDPTGSYNATTSQDLVKFLSDVLDENLKGSTIILECMKQSERLTKIPEAIPEGIPTANKTGELEVTENDTAIVYGNNRTFTISIMADKIIPERAVQEIHELTSMAYNCLEVEEASE